jgi:hypothetical protein
MIKARTIQKAVWVEEIEDVLCNQCGNSMSYHLPPPQDEMIRGGTGEIVFGYGSNKDTLTHRFHICDNCMDMLCAGFKIPCDVTEEL